MRKTITSLVWGLHHKQKNHHRPRVNKGKHTGMWYATCPCGYLRFFHTWHRAYVAAEAHSQELL